MTKRKMWNVIIISLGIISITGAIVLPLAYFEKNSEMPRLEDYSLFFIDYYMNYSIGEEMPHLEANYSFIIKRETEIGQIDVSYNDEKIINSSLWLFITDFDRLKGSNFPVMNSLTIEAKNGNQIVFRQTIFSRKPFIERYAIAKNNFSRIPTDRIIDGMRSVPSTASHYLKIDFFDLFYSRINIWAVWY